MNALAEIRIIDGDRARAAIADRAFVEQWLTLAEACPWYTGFQNPAFAVAWYASYREICSPVIVSGWSNNGTLSGLLALGQLQDGELVAAGGRQAEYQMWIALPDVQDEFPKRALMEIRSRLGANPLCLQYLTPDLPMGWLDDATMAFCDIEDVRRPLMVLSSEDIEQSWKKKSNKSRFNRLARLGEVVFERITSPEVLRPMLDDIMTIYDIRQASMSGTLPFFDDARKADFHLELLNSPGVLHATILRVGPTVVSAHLGVTSPKMAHIGVLAHSPAFSRHSPGKLHVMFLSRQLVGEGVRVLDLTPGGDPWKDRSATEFDQVKRLTVFATQGDKKQQERRGRLKARIKAVAANAGVSAKDASGIAAALSGKSPAEILRSAGRKAKSVLPHTVELRAYSMALPASSVAATPHAKRDVLSDLLRFREAAGTASRQDFYRTSLARLEEGHHCYTVVQDDRLVHWGWLAEGQERATLDEVHQFYTYPAGSVALYDFYTDPAYRGRGLYTKTIAQMLADASSAGHAQAWIFVTADNADSRRVIEKSGFAYALSLFERTALGKRTKWRSDGAVEAELPATEPQDEPPATRS